MWADLVVEKQLYTLVPEEVDRARRRRDADAKRVVGSGGAGSGSSNGESGSDNWRARKKRLLRRAAPVPYDDGVFVTPVVFRSAAERELARLWACIGELTADCLCRITRRVCVPEENKDEALFLQNTAGECTPAAFTAKTIKEKRKPQH